MKKLLALIVCGTMVLSMTACGGSKETPAAQNDVSVQAGGRHCRGCRGRGSRR